MVLPLSLCVGCRSCVGKLVPHMESVEAASLLICGGEFQVGMIELLTNAQVPPPVFHLSHLCPLPWS